MEPSSAFFTDWVEKGKIRELNGGKDGVKNTFGGGRQATLGFPCGSAGKESARRAGATGSIPGLERSPGEGKGYPLQHSGLENSMDCIVHGVAESWDTTERLSLSSNLTPKCPVLTPDSFLLDRTRTAQG